MSDYFIGQIAMFGGNFAPRGWTFCDGQILPIQQYTALFSLLGTTYGGNGQTTFGLPDLRSRLPVHQGQGPGLSNYDIGQSSGAASITIDQNTLPSHTHTLNATNANATASAIANTLLPGKPTATDAYAYATPLGNPNPALISQTLAAGSCSTVGSGQAHSNLMPSLSISFIICLEGIFPSRN